MVKRFISGILGKKGEEPKAESKDEVPDELPPLAEEIIAKAAAEPKKDLKAEAAAKETEKEVPEELPPLEESGMQNKPEDAVAGTLDDLETENIPDEIKKAKLAKIRLPESKTPAEIKEAIQRTKEDYSVRERIKAGAEAGFFSNVLEHIRKHEGAKERILAGDLFSRMGNYWEMRKHEIKAGTQMPAEKKLEEDLISKLEDLKIMEQKWQVQKLALEEDIKFIHEREREIQSKIKELTLVSNELGLFRNVKPEEYFHMHNGLILKNLHDLIDVLEIIDDETLQFHASNSKNDFSDWIRHVFKDNNLAGKIKDAKSKIEMIEILEKIPISSEQNAVSPNYPANPKKYFWLANGSLIRNILELSDALKMMDDELYKMHVNEIKNDFTSWIRNVIKNEHLADKLDKAKSKKEMIEILEVFL